MTRRKPTRQQVVVLEALTSREDFMSAQDLHAHLRNDGHTIGLATVYRALQTFAAEAEVDVLRTDDGEAVYRRCSTTHHHHLVCRRCGRTVEVEGPAVEEWAAAVSATHGFTAVTHEVEIFGTCAQCTAQAEANRG